MRDKFLRAGPNLQGIVLNLTAIFVFSLMDAVAKHLVVGHYPPLQVVWTRYLGQTVLMAILIAPRARSYLATDHPFLQAARSVAQFGASAFFFFSLAYIGLAEATAVADLSPLLITLGAALFLGERIGPRRLVAVGVAIVGALLIIRPGSAIFTPAALLPLACAFCFASFALLTRALGPGEGMMTSLFYSAVCGTVLTSVMMPTFWVPVARGDIWAFVLIGLMGTLAQIFLIGAYRTAPAAVIAPFGYAGILFATCWGLIFFGEWPDGLTILGMLVIVGAGLYVWHREARLTALAAGKPA